MNAGSVSNGGPAGNTPAPQTSSSPGVPNYPTGQPSSLSQNDLVNLIRDWVGDKSLKTQLEFYLNNNPITPKAAHKLITLFLFALNSSIVVSNIPTEREAMKLKALYKIMRAQFPMGLTRFDLNDTTLHVISGIDHLYANQLFRAAKGFTMKRVGTHTIESHYREEGTQPEQQEQNVLSRASKFLR